MLVVWLGASAVFGMVLDAVVLRVGFRQLRWGFGLFRGGARFGAVCGGLPSGSSGEASASDGPVWSVPDLGGLGALCLLEVVDDGEHESCDGVGCESERAA